MNITELSKNVNLQVHGDRMQILWNRMGRDFQGSNLPNQGYWGFHDDMIKYDSWIFVDIIFH